jgi:hypothetical protein
MCWQIEQQAPRVFSLLPLLSSLFLLLASFAVPPE